MAQAANSQAALQLCVSFVVCGTATGKHAPEWLAASVLERLQPRQAQHPIHYPSQHLSQHPSRQKDFSFTGRRRTVSHQGTVST